LPDICYRVVNVQTTLPREKSEKKLPIIGGYVNKAYICTPNHFG